MSYFLPCLPSWIPIQYERQSHVLVPPWPIQGLIFVIFGTLAEVLLASSSVLASSSGGKRP